MLPAFLSRKIGEFFFCLETGNPDFLFADAVAERAIWPVWDCEHIELSVSSDACVVFFKEDFIAQSAATDGDIDRIERMQVCEELWKHCSDKIEVKFLFLTFQCLLSVRII